MQVSRLRVRLSLESPRAKEVAKLIRTYGGEPFVVPAMREAPLESHRQALEFADGLMQGNFDLVIFLTGVGVRALLEILQARYNRDDFLEALRSVRIAARGSKPQAALREINVPVTVTSAEPSTWREVMSALQSGIRRSACVDARCRSLAGVLIDPTTSEELAHYGIKPNFEPSRPKMGFLVGLRPRRPRNRCALRSIPFAASPSPSDHGRVPRRADSISFFTRSAAACAAADSCHVVLGRVGDFVTAVIPCDSCFIYVLEEENFVLRGVRSQTRMPTWSTTSGCRSGHVVTGWVAEHREPVAIASNASSDPRFQAFKNVPEDQFEAMLCTPILCASKVVGVINLQHRESYQHAANEVRLLSMIGFLVGAEIARARLETENAALAGRLETRKAVDRAKGVLQRASRSPRKKLTAGCSVRAVSGESRCARSPRPFFWVMICGR